MQQYVADGLVIICLSGLRWVSKEDSQFAGRSNSFYLEWNFKGSEHKQEYPDKESRDKMYDKLVEALTKEKKGA